MSELREWYRWNVAWPLRAAWCGLRTRHAATYAIHCEEDCCGASLLFYECGCGTYEEDVTRQHRYRYDDDGQRLA